jgi:hypothetical protein
MRCNDVVGACGLQGQNVPRWKCGSYECALGWGWINVSYSSQGGVGCLARLLRRKYNILCYIMKMHGKRHIA